MSDKLLTHSRMACFKRCPREHYYRYELAIRPISDAPALRIGSVIHSCLEYRANGMSLDGCITEINRVYDDYAADISDVDRLVEIDVERVTVRALIRGYFAAWPNDYKILDDHTDPLTPVQSIVAERAFNLPILNPHTGKPTRTFRKGGKIDEIVKLHDGRLAILETKTTADDISETSDYWIKLRLDHQISHYMLSAREMDFSIDTVLYNVIKKPGMRPCQVPILDDDGVKIVRDMSGERVRNKDGKTWRQSADAAQGWTLVTRTETPDEYEARLSADIESRPEFYYARREIPRLASDLDEFADELFQQSNAIREAQKHGRWYRNPAQCSAMGRCPYLDVCHSGIKPDGQVPAGFQQVANIHPELGA